MSEQSQVDVVLSAERVEVSTRRVPVERVRVRREVVTEEMTVVVTVRREVLRVVHEPLDAASTGPTDGAEELSSPRGAEVLDLVLSAERPVVSLEVVPYERVRVGTRLVATSTPLTVTASREVVDLTSTPA